MAPSRHISGLPMAPGNSVRDFSMPDYRKRSTLGMRGGVMQVGDPNETKLPQEESLGRTLAKKLGLKDVPEHVTFDGKVLRYECFFKEAVVESNQENYRVRRCVILFYLLDGSLQVRCPGFASGSRARWPSRPLAPPPTHASPRPPPPVHKPARRSRRSRSPSSRIPASRRARARAPSSSAGTACRSPTVRAADPAARRRLAAGPRGRQEAGGNRSAAL